MSEEYALKELSLFTGAGGGILGTHLLGWTPIGYVEFNDYCQRVLAARIADGYIPDAPIFGDIRAFNSKIAGSYRGLVDIITAGFPCQPFSCAGKQLEADDPRNMWPATRDSIGIVRPRYCFLENVPGLLSSGYFGTVIGDLSAMGYDCRWGVLSAADTGAPHIRKRLWIVANAQRPELRDESGRIGGSHREGAAESGDNGKTESLANTKLHGSSAPRRGCGETETHTGFADSGWWASEPDVDRVADRVASRVDRLKAIGNGQVPVCVRLAWETLKP